MRAGISTPYYEWEAAGEILRAHGLMNPEIIGKVNIIADEVLVRMYDNRQKNEAGIDE